MKSKTWDKFSKLLQERNEYPERASRIDRKINKTFGETRAVLVMDMSGFSRLTIKHGLIHFLAMIHRMHQIALPTVEEHKGEVIKWEADNVFAVFPEVEQAVDAAIDILNRFSAANTMLPEEMDLYGKFGIGYGETLLIEREDLYGAEVNIASKLGEDLARAGEILLSEAAFARVDALARRYKREKKSISGLSLIIHKVLYDEQPRKTSRKRR
ncbi:MAG TPA: adenylate/guanylate cyclase domain-containing protein [Pyrinomonadaceae bacterium]|nr:adenylate/guanylate cyclase domain-containing protein [Pyrinomonadaceae bacterium]